MAISEISIAFYFTNEIVSCTYALSLREIQKYQDYLIFTPFVWQERCE